jgi:predicted ABC-type ATPase
MDRPRLYVFAGPNGSGKSTLVLMLRERSVDLGVHINPDQIELSLPPGNPVVRSRQAQAIADDARARCLRDKKTFSFETVMSHPSKIDVMKQAGYAGFRVELFFVSVENPEINIDRVDLRVRRGGHSVPHDRILARYRRTMALLPRAILAAERTVLFDNSMVGEGPRAFAEFTRVEDRLQGVFARPLSAWYRRVVLANLETDPVAKGNVHGSAYDWGSALTRLDLKLTTGMTFP